MSRYQLMLVRDGAPLNRLRLLLASPPVGESLNPVPLFNLNYYTFCPTCLLPNSASRLGPHPLGPYTTILPTLPFFASLHRRYRSER